jgi:hypothetical protein
MEGGHDFTHLLLFALYSDYAAELRLGNRMLLKNMNKGFMSRAAFNLEALALVNPKKLDQIRENLLLTDLSPKTSINDFQVATHRLSVEQLVEHAKFWEKHLQEYLVSFTRLE